MQPVLEMDVPDGDFAFRPVAETKPFGYLPLTGEPLCVVDGSTGVTLLPGCCCGLEGRRQWHEVVDGGERPWLGHDPQPTAERFGDTVRLTVGSGQSDSPVIELSASELGRLLVGVERDLADFVAPAADWASRHLPGRSASLAAALARLLDLPLPAVPQRR
ncbi:hypothetical protein OG948_33145 [Embleya sp. NBC_00888]|uniref:hypothetical protein n=1 Tax=Embleya sp. NBC_00888 TaxID=2975960 RepID=UPI00386DECEF|nr:hypothetical protein OG948_33145 [Embleya sp. NBC_00888]